MGSLKPLTFISLLISALVLVFSIIVALLLYSDYYKLLFEAPKQDDIVAEPVKKYNIYEKATDAFDFGCEFISTGYKLRNHPPKTASDAFFRKPIWGKEREPLILSDENELVELIEEINQINADVLEALPYNSFNNFIDFYEAYKRSGLEFRPFYASYQPSFRPAENCIGLAIESLSRIHKRLASRWPQLPHHTYLVSSRNVTDEWLWEEKWQNSEERDGDHLMVGIRETKHVIGALKVEVKGRQGVILLDQGYAIETPVVLMMDEQPPHSDSKFAKEYNETYNYELIDDNRYALWSITAEDDDEVSEYHRIYVHRPYCSFLYNTEKRDLLRDIRSIVRRNRDGTMHSGAFFKIRQNLSETFVNLIKTNETTAGSMRYGVPFINISKEAVENNPNLQTRLHLEMVGKLNDVLGMEPGVLLEKLQKVGVILRDEKFINGCRELEAEEKTKYQSFSAEYIAINESLNAGNNSELLNDHNESQTLSNDIESGNKTNDSLIVENKTKSLSNDNKA